MMLVCFPREGQIILTPKSSRNQRGPTPSLTKPVVGEMNQDRSASPIPSTPLMYVGSNELSERGEGGGRSSHNLALFPLSPHRPTSYHRSTHPHSMSAAAAAAAAADNGLTGESRSMPVGVDHGDFTPSETKKDVGLGLGTSCRGAYIIVSQVGVAPGRDCLSEDDAPSCQPAGGSRSGDRPCCGYVDIPVHRTEISLYLLLV